jgi:hypothetical protein
MFDGISRELLKWEWGGINHVDNVGLISDGLECFVSRVKIVDVVIYALVWGYQEFLEDSPYSAEIFATFLLKLSLQIIASNKSFFQLKY